MKKFLFQVGFTLVDRVAYVPTLPPSQLVVHVTADSAQEAITEATTRVEGLIVDKATNARCTTVQQVGELQQPQIQPAGGLILGRN